MSPNSLLKVGIVVFIGFIIAYAEFWHIKYLVLQNKFEKAQINYVSVTNKLESINKINKVESIKTDRQIEKIKKQTISGDCENNINWMVDNLNNN